MFEQPVSPLPFIINLHQGLGIETRHFIWPTSQDNKIAQTNLNQLSKMGHLVET